MMKKIQHDNIRSVAVKQDALDDIYAHFDEVHRSTVFQEECRSWFKDGKKKNRIYLWPGPVCLIAFTSLQCSIIMKTDTCSHRQSTSSRASRTPASKTTISGTDTRIDLHTWATARCWPTRPRTSSA